MQSYALKCVPEPPDIFLKYFSLHGRISSENVPSSLSPKIVVLFCFVFASPCSTLERGHNSFVLNLMGYVFKNA